MATVTAVGARAGADVTTAYREMVTPRADGCVARAATPQELADWDALVATFPQSRITHTDAWLRALEDAGGGPTTRIVVERDGDVVGVLPGQLRRLGPLRLFGSPLPGWQTSSMGPAFAPARVSASAVMRAATDWLAARHHVHHVELISPHLPAAAMHALGFRGEPVPTYRATLEPGAEVAVFARLRPSARRNVRRAQGLGIRIEWERGPGFGAEAYRHIRDVFVRGGHSVPFDVRRVETFVERLQGTGRLAAVSARGADGRVIAVGLFTIAPPELALWQWAHCPALRWYRATELLTWTVMVEAMARGCTTFDLMGDGPFKANFGAVREEVATRWLRSRPTWLRHCREGARWAYARQQQLRGRLAGLRPSWRRAGEERTPEEDGAK